MENDDRIAPLISRLARLGSSDDWAAGLNPAQVAALDYLARANRFSRSPSHLADYLGTTRGTVSQTLKSLLRKGLVVEERSASDRRSISYALAGPRPEVRPDGQTLRDATRALDPDQRKALDHLLQAVLQAALAATGGKPFGICHTCRHFSARAEGGHCLLLKADLAPAETRQICHEQVAA